MHINFKVGMEVAIVQRQAGGQAGRARPTT